MAKQVQTSCACKRLMSSLRASIFMAGTVINRLINNSINLNFQLKGWVANVCMQDFCVHHQHCQF